MSKENSVSPSNENKNAKLWRIIAIIAIVLPIYSFIVAFINQYDEIQKGLLSSDSEEQWAWIAGMTIIILIVAFFSFTQYKGINTIIHPVKSSKKALLLKIEAVFVLVLFFPLAIGFTYSNYTNYRITTRGPYLSWTEDPKTTMTITWETPRVHSYKFYWGSSPEDLNNEAEIKMVNARDYEGYQGYYHYTVTLRGLTPDTKYYYKIEGIMSSPAPFRTAPDDKNKSFSFIAYGDSREPNYIFDNQHIPLVKQMIKNAHDPAQIEDEYAFVINSGDIAQDYDVISSWDLHFEAIRPLADRVPYFVASGNHEWLDEKLWDFSVQPALDIQEFPYNASVLEKEDDVSTLDEVSYAFGYGSVYVIMIGFPHAGSDNETFLNWLDTQLAIGNSSYLFTIAVFHRPPFDDRVGTESDDNEDVIRNLVPHLFYGDVDVVINGHNHVLARHNITWAQAEDPSREITFLTTGCGGASLRDYEGGYWANNYTLGFYGKTVFHAKIYHYYRVDVDPSRRVLTFTAYDLEGKIIDHFEQYCG